MARSPIPYGSAPRCSIGFSEYIPVNGVPGRGLDATSSCGTPRRRSISGFVRTRSTGRHSHTGEPRSDRRRRQCADHPEPVSPVAPGARVRRQPVRRAGRRHDHRRRRDDIGVTGIGTGRARIDRPEPGLRLRVERAGHVVRLSGRDSDSVSQRQVSGALAPGLGSSTSCVMFSTRAQRHVVPDEARRCVVSRAIRHADRADGSGRGLVLDLNPFVTENVGPRVDAAQYSVERPHLAPMCGGASRLISCSMAPTVRTSRKSNRTPRSSSIDPRDAVQYPEKRPFFLDGLEQFNTPNNLIYTRQIESPLAATKLTGKVGDVSLAYLGAIDQEFGHPVFNVARVREDFSQGSEIGAVFTDREAGGDFNRLAGVDSRITLGSLYTLNFQAASSITRDAGVSTAGPLWSASFTRTGRAMYVDASIRASTLISTPPAASSRGNIVRSNLDWRYTFYPKHSFFDTFAIDLNYADTWVYRQFTSFDAPEDRQFHPSPSRRFMAVDNPCHARPRDLRVRPLAVHELLLGPYHGTRHDLYPLCRRPRDSEHGSQSADHDAHIRQVRSLAVQPLWARRQFLRAVAGQRLDRSADVELSADEPAPGAAACTTPRCSGGTTITRSSARR